MGFWNRLVKKAKQVQSDARASALRTGGGNPDAQPIDATTAQVLSVGQTEVRFQNQGEYLHAYLGPCPLALRVVIHQYLRVMHLRK
jgi:hypothetical protein